MKLWESLNMESWNFVWIVIGIANLINEKYRLVFRKIHKIIDDDFLQNKSVFLKYSDFKEYAFLLPELSLK